MVMKMCKQKKEYVGPGYYQPQYSLQRKNILAGNAWSKSRVERNLWRRNEDSEEEKETQLITNDYNSNELIGNN